MGKQVRWWSLTGLGHPGDDLPELPCVRLEQEVWEMLWASLIRLALTVGFRPVPQTTPLLAVSKVAR
jgi:hypothetical protein